jgi:hypothetical protein
LIAALRAPRSPRATSTWKDEAMMTMQAPSSTWLNARSQNPSAKTRHRSPPSRNHDPQNSIRRGPTESISWPAGIAMKMGSTALSVIIIPMAKVEAPSASA